MSTETLISNKMEIHTVSWRGFKSLVNGVTNTLLSKNAKTIVWSKYECVYDITEALSMDKKQVPMVMFTSRLITLIGNEINGQIFELKLFFGHLNMFTILMVPVAVPFLKAIPRPMLSGGCIYFGTKFKFFDILLIITTSMPSYEVLLDPLKG